MKSTRAAGTNRAPLFELTGGRLCLDFANTVDFRPSPRHKELLNSYTDLVAWSRQSGALSNREAMRLLRAAARHPRKAEAALLRARELRETLYAIFSPLADGRAPSRGDLDKLNTLLAGAWARSQLVRAKAGFEWKFRGQPGALDAMLWAVSRSAAEMMTSNELARVRECATIDCGWLFLDQSRNRSRRWCDMKVCGNRSKVRRFRARAARS